MPRYLHSLICLLLISGTAGLANAQFGNSSTTGNGLSDTLGQNPFLRVTEAFVPTLRWDDNQQAHLDWAIEADYYLYRARFVYRSDDGSMVYATYPPGVTKYDEFFQENLEVYFDQLQTPLDLAPSAQNLYVQFQGCAEAGLCYPPTWVGFEVDSQSGSAGYLGELPDGPPDTATASNAELLPKAAESAPDSEKAGLPITLIIGCLSGLLFLCAVVFFLMRKQPG